MASFMHCVMIEQYVRMRRRRFLLNYSNGSHARPRENGTAAAADATAVDKQTAQVSDCILRDKVGNFSREGANIKVQSYTREVNDGGRRRCRSCRLPTAAHADETNTNR